MYKAKIIFFGLLVLAAVLLGSLYFRGGSKDSGDGTPLVMFCAAGIRVPVEEIAAAYEAEYGVPVQLQYGGSGTLLSSLKVSNADIYLAADSSYTDLAEEEGILAETMAVSFFDGGAGGAEGESERDSIAGGFEAGRFESGGGESGCGVGGQVYEEGAGEARGLGGGGAGGDVADGERIGELVEAGDGGTWR